MNGVARYQGAHGRYELRQETIGAESTTTLSAMGAIVGIGGGVFATRPVEESFALVRVPGVEGVRAFASHQEIGKTGRRGDLLIPDLQAYYGNILNIADGDIPLQYAVPDVGMTLAPPYRGGAVALFDVQRVQRVLGKIVIAGQEQAARVRRADRDWRERRDLRIAGRQRRCVLLRKPADGYVFGGRREPAARSARSR